MHQDSGTSSQQSEVQAVDTLDLAGQEREKDAAAEEQAVTAHVHSLPAEDDGVFDRASRAGFLTLFLLLVVQSWSSFLGMNLYCPVEVENVLAYRESVAQGLWLAPIGRGDMWPGFFWFLRGLDWSFAHTMPQCAHLLFPLAAMLGSLLALLGVLTLGRAAGLPRTAALAGGLTLFCAPVFLPLSSFLGPQSLALALTLFSLACLCQGWRQERAFLLLPLGFALAALAGLSGGVLFLALPLASSLIFIFWRCSFRRGRALDGLLGFVLLLLVVGGWLVGVILWQPAAAYLQHLGQNLVVWPLASSWWKALAVAGVGLLPWLAVPCCVSWLRVVRFAPWDLLSSRKENAGVAFLWIALAVSCALSPLATSPLGAALCMASVAAPLLGKALLRLPPAGCRLFHAIAGLFLACVGIVLIALYFDGGRQTLVDMTHIPLTDAQSAVLAALTGLPVLGGLCLVAALAVLRMALGRKRTGMGKALLVYAGIAVLLTQPAALLLAPQLARMPAAQVRHLEDIPGSTPSQVPEQAASQKPTQAVGQESTQAAGQEEKQAPEAATSSAPAHEAPLVSPSQPAPAAQPAPDAQPESQSSSALPDTQSAVPDTQSAVPQAEDKPAPAQSMTPSGQEVPAVPTHATPPVSPEATDTTAKQPAAE